MKMIPLKIWNTFFGHLLGQIIKNYNKMYECAIFLEEKKKNTKRNLNE